MDGHVAFGGLHVLAEGDNVGFDLAKFCSGAIRLVHGSCSSQNKLEGDNKEGGEKRTS